MTSSKNTSKTTQETLKILEKGRKLSFSCKGNMYLLIFSIC